MSLTRTAAPVFAAALAASVLAVAAPSSEAAGALVIHKGGSCSLLDGSGSLVDAGQSRSVKNKKRGLWKCTGKVTPAAGKKAGQHKAVTFSGKKTGTPCITPNGTTMRWHETVSASGHATLTCHFR